MGKTIGRRFKGSRFDWFYASIVQLICMQGKPLVKGLKVQWFNGPAVSWFKGLALQWLNGSVM